MPNDNCLEGIACPGDRGGCGSEGPFKIVAKTTVTMYDYGHEETIGMDWGDDAFCECTVCGKRGVVRDFKIEPTKENQQALPVGHAAPAIAEEQQSVNPAADFVQKVAALLQWGESDPDNDNKPFDPSDGVDDSHSCLMELIDEARECAKTLESNRGIPFTLVDTSGRGGELAGSVDLGPAGLLLKFDGYSDFTSADNMGAPVLVEFYDNSVRVTINGDINKEEPTHAVSLDGAKNSSRLPEFKGAPGPR